MGGNAITILEGQSVDNVLGVGTDARIAGKVSDAVIIIDGNVYLDPSAQVDLVINLGGHVYNSAVKSAETGVLEVSFSEKLMNESLLGGAIIFGTWILKVVSALIGIVLLTGLGYLMRHRLGPSEKLVASEFFRLFGLGLAVAFLLTSLVVLLMLTVYGIPLAVFIALLGSIVVVIGLIPLIQYLGNQVLSTKLLEYPPLTKGLAQSMLFIAIASIPLIGAIFLIIMGLTGLGLALTMGWMRIKGYKTF